MKRKKGDGSVFQRGAIWWVKYYRNGKPYRESSGSDKESDARKLLKKRVGEITLGRFIGPDSERVTIRELAEDYLNDYCINGRKSLDKAEGMVNASMKTATKWTRNSSHPSAIVRRITWGPIA
jgi:hypothetical protein